MIRYRYNERSTRETIKRFHHIARLGKLHIVRGYRHTSTRSYVYEGEKRNLTTNRECVLVKGENGSCRFEGLCWNYFGEGPRGLAKLLVACGFTQEAADNIVVALPRKNEDGIDWELKLDRFRIAHWLSAYLNDPAGFLSKP